MWISNVIAQKGPAGLNHSNILNVLLSSSQWAPQTLTHQKHSTGEKVTEYPSLNYSRNFLIFTHYVSQIWSTLISIGEETIIESKFKKKKKKRKKVSSENARAPSFRNTQILYISQQDTKLTGSLIYRLWYVYIFVCMRNQNHEYHDNHP